jgi:uncharacterized protein
LGLSQRELAERSGVKQPLISAIESGRREPSAATTAALDAALPVRPSDVLRLRRGDALEVIQRHRGGETQVFGSVARGTDGPGSDLDLLVVFAEDAGIGDLLAMEEELADLLTVGVDVVSAGSSGRVLDRARGEAVPL